MNGNESLDIFSSRCPIVARESRHFKDTVIVGGERQHVIFSREILWLAESQTRLFYEHGGRELRTEATHSDFYGFLTSTDDADYFAVACNAYAIDTVSTLELKSLTSLLLTPVIEIPATKTNNPNRHGHRNFARVPRWLLAPSSTSPDSPNYLRPTVLVEHVSRTSRRPAEENEQALQKMKSAWLLMLGLFFEQPANSVEAIIQLTTSKMLAKEL